ncbi:MAG: hypothetical protein FJ245_15035 [Nitrospira sp.]|nr:hypothetical protein [Nitrospira sp.]
MALMSTQCRVRGLTPARLVAYYWLPLLACLLAACQMPHSVRPGEGPLPVEGSDRLQFPGWIKALAFSQGGRTLMAGGCEFGGNSEAPCTRGLVSVWNLQEMTSEATFRFPKAVTAMAVSPDGTKWVAGDSEGRLILSTEAARGRSPRLLHQNRAITALAFSPDGQWVASGSLDASFPLGIMEMKTGGVIRVNAMFAPVSAVAFSRDGKDLGIGMQNGSLVVWGVSSQTTPIPITAGSGERWAISSLAFSPDDRLLAYGRQDGRVVIVDRASGQAVSEIRRGSAVTALVFSPDGQYLALGQDNGKVVLIESDGAREIWSKRHIVSVADLAYSPDGMSLAVAAQQGVFLYQMGGADSNPSSLPRAERMTKTNYRYNAIPDPRLTRSPEVSSRKFSRVLQVSQDEYFWLLPFDRLISSSIDAMRKVVPGAVVERVGPAGPNQIVLVAGGRSLAIDLSQLRRAEGRSGLRQAVETYESAQRVFLAAWPGAATVLEDAAVSAILAELGPGLRLMPQLEVSPRTQARMDSAKDDHGRSFSASIQGAEEAVLGDGIRYLKLAKFSRSSAKQVQRWVAGGASTQGGAIAHVLDLRNNAGADLDSVLETAESFLPNGEVITELIARKTGERTQYRSKGIGRAPRGLVVLVNERTGGTAELLACAIRESGVGMLVGSGTSGVDDVYGLFPLPGGDALRVSTGRFFCPGQRSLRWKGQTVDVEAGQVSPIGGITVGVSRTESFLRSRIASPLPAGLPVTTDYQLRVGVEVATCLGRVQLRNQGMASPIRRTEGSIGLLTACHMSPQ